MLRWVSSLTSPGGDVAHTEYERAGGRGRFEEGRQRVLLDVLHDILAQWLGASSLYV